MGVLTFFGMLITGSIFSFGILMLFKNRIIPGVSLLVLSVISYIAYYYVATTYFT
jgi:hypothetical protein